MAQKPISQGTLKTDFGVNNRPILDLKLNECDTTFCKIFYQNY